MAAKKGCCCLRTLVSLLVALVILVGTVYCLYSFTSLSTYGVKRIGDFELGALADVKLKDLWGAFRGLTHVNEDAVVSQKLDTAQGDSAYREIFGEAGQPGTSDAGSATVTVDGVSQAVTDENIAHIVTQPVCFDRQVVLRYTDDFLGVLFGKLLGGENQVSDALASLGEVEVSQFAISVKNGKAELSVVVRVDIGSIVESVNAHLPGFFRLGEYIYLTSVTEFDVATQGAEAGRLVAVQGGKSSVRVNQLDESLSQTVYGFIREQLAGGAEEIPAELTEINGLVFEQFADVAANLGYAGTLGQDGERVPGGDNVVEDGALNLLTNVREAA